ncbi:signal peptidase I [Hymenobacter convexus]|uniref:signal peptidase I n=1 Tax=Hymenobacter sp. CA1UV-4 TaxID=3063782 RepID=UPI002712A056|nr:signal peptidase I [Hymenobacter sp. CA1UV-4]MDO7854739.1 signal peptidase I [Hymenobacter sp. CA1UV-4]
MGNVFKWLAISVGSVLALGALALVLWVAGRLTHAFDFYQTPSNANAPTFIIGDQFFISRWVKPERLDFIAYRSSLPEDGPTVFSHRLCGLPGDTVELRRSRLFVNGQDLDLGLQLVHHYALARADYARLPRPLFKDTTGIIPIGDSLYQVGLADADAARPALRAVRKVQPAGYRNPAILNVFPAGRNEDNFGPVVVPAGAYFVLGDNRQNARDSRYIGWVRQADVVGTVLGQH